MRADGAPGDCHGMLACGRVALLGPFGVSALFRATDFRNYMLFDIAGWMNTKYTVECFVNGRQSWDGIP